MKKLIAVCIVVEIILITSSARANTTTSSTMWFEGWLEHNSLTGAYTGTIHATEGYYYVGDGPGAAIYNGPTPPSEYPQGGFDVYAKEGGTAYVQGMSPDDTWTIGSNHDAYSQGGLWGNWYNPDVPNYWNYHLELTETTWRVWAFDDRGTTYDDPLYPDAYETPLEGTIDWSTMIAYETGANWNPTWTWGEENIPLQYGSFAVSITREEGEDDHESEFYAVSLTPVPTPGAILLASIGVALVGWLHRRRTL